VVHDRGYLLGASKRDEVLELWEVERYGADSFGDPDRVALYGLRPAEWHARGARVRGRTAVECTRDALADLIGRDVAATAAASPAGGCVVVDPFAGSANTLHWIARHLRPRRAVGFELDPGVFEVTDANLAALHLDVEIELEHVGHEAGLRALRVGDDELLVAFLAPPWGDALDELEGLDLTRTTPPVPDVVDLVAATFPGRDVLLAVQVYENVVGRSLAALASRCRWSALRIYDLDAPGENHGLFLGTLGWAP
jgi:hypothetical protein